MKTFKYKRDFDDMDNFISSVYDKKEDPHPLRHLVAKYYGLVGDCYRNGMLNYYCDGFEGSYCDGFEGSYWEDANEIIDTLLANKSICLSRKDVEYLKDYKHRMLEEMTVEVKLRELRDKLEDTPDLTKAEKTALKKEIKQLMQTPCNYYQYAISNMDLFRPEKQQGPDWEHFLDKVEWMLANYIKAYDLQN